MCGIHSPAQINCNSIPLQLNYQYVGSLTVVANSGTNTGTITLSGRIDENPVPANLIAVDETGTFTDTATGNKLTAPTIVTVYFTCTETDGDSCGGPTFMTLHFSYEYNSVGGGKGHCNLSGGDKGQCGSGREGQHSSGGIALERALACTAEHFQRLGGEPQIRVERTLPIDPVKKDKEQNVGLPGVAPHSGRVTAYSFLITIGGHTEIEKSG